MYTHGQAAIVLCEAFAMTGDEELRVPAQKAIDFIVKAQYHDGGWRYQPGPAAQRGDTSVVGWQLMALQSARAANLTVPEETWQLADLYLDSVQHHGGSRYSYQAGGGPTGDDRRSPALPHVSGLDQGARRPSPRRRSGCREPRCPTTSTRTSTTGTTARRSCTTSAARSGKSGTCRCATSSCQSQETGGHAAGSWAPRSHDHASAGGRIYITSLSVCTLEVYYRHLPIFRQMELAGVDPRSR